MQQNFNNIEFLFSSMEAIAKFRNMHPLQTFADESIGFLNYLSAELNKDKRTKLYPDVATFSFFCRKANLIHLKNKYSSEEKLSIGKGLLFHIAPSNVPINFAFSLVSGIITGNCNIVRVPSKNFEQVTIIADAIRRIDSENNFKNITERIALVKYDKQSIATSYFSDLCDVRIIWGGDETIENIRLNKIPPRSFDVTFADRYSFGIINADTFIKDEQPSITANGFYNDTYLFDQNACTSPHLIIWFGNDDNIKKSKVIFWKNVYEIVKQRYELQSVVAVDKLTSFYFQAANLQGTTKVESIDNLIWRLSINEITPNIENFKSKCGYFSEYNAKSLIEIGKIINRKCQTFSYYGFTKEQLKSLILELKPLGIDRIVPFGRTMDFSLTWDGYNLVNTLSREIEVI